MMTSPLHHFKRAFRLAAFTTLAAFGLVFTQLSAQEIRIDQFDAVDACQGTLTDEGGVAGNTSAGTTNTITICSNSGAIDETHVSVNLTDIAISGTIDVYNSDMVDPANQIGIPIDETANGTNLVFEATAANASGCLTFVFNSTGVAPGFQGLISCVRACQPVIATLTSSTPPVSPVDTGYIDVCVGDEITFNGAGIYPENGVIYNQSDATSSFQWNFDDGNSANTATATHIYTEPGGYTVQLFIVDINGCDNNNLISQRVRVSPTPSFNLQNDFVAIACAEDTLTLRGSTQFSPNPNSEILVTTTEQSFGASQVLADTTFLPDGNGVSYSTTLQFNNFQAGQVVTSIEDIESICLNMEHSYAGDLDLFITCPNGSQVDFIQFSGPGLGGQYFGIPVDVDADLSPGIGFDYCFVPGDPTLLSIADYAINIGVGGAESFPAGDYASVTPWEALIGCPLNGDWTINIQDNLFSDNGYIFSWGIAFADELFSDLETYTVGIQSAGFQETEDLIFYSADSIVAVPDAAGVQQYTYQIVDDFGCFYDTTLTIEVLPTSDPDCYDCQPLLDEFFQEEMAAVGQQVPTTLASQEVLFQDVAFRVNPVDDFGSTLYPSLGAAYVSQINVSSISPFGLLSVPDQLVSICVNLESSTTGGIRLYARAPDNTLLELSTGNGGTGSNYTQTCFTPTATTPITSGTPPFTGDFQPEGLFSNLDGAPINGNWTLLAWDVSGNTDVGTFISWSITFRTQNEITYSWTPDNGTLSCTDCPNPVITVDGVTETYTVVATDSYGCSETGTVNIIANLDVAVTLDGSDVSCFGEMDGQVNATISGGVAPYDIVWSPEASGTTLENLGPGTYIIMVTDSLGSMASDTFVVNEPTEIIVQAAISNVLCNGEETGFIDLAISGGVPPYTTEPANLDMLAAGDYEVTVFDSTGCSITSVYTIEEPEALELSAEVTDVSCGGDEDGAIDLTVTGGTGTYNFAWTNGAETEDLNGLDGGTYGVIVTDENGCTAELNLNVDEASTLEVVSLTVTDLLCFEDNSGEISLEVSGGTPPYTYLWSNGDETATISNLAAGIYSGVLTDSVGCTISTGDLEVLQPEELLCEALVVQEPDLGDNGAASVEATGGTGAYSYLWSNGDTTQTIEGLVAGDYCVTVTDENDCSTECCVTLEAFATVGDFVFFDDDRDGIQDAGETGIGGATVTINSTDGGFTASTTTDVDGFYSFLVAPGTYTLTFSNPGGLAASPANQGGDDELDSDIIQATFTTPVITLAINEDNLSVDAGFFDPCDPALTSAGTIAENQTLCGPGNVPAQLTQVTPATGGSGDYNYIWMKTTGDPNAPIENWIPIPNTNSINYQPGVLYEDTYFTRCVRQDECPYIESNVIMIDIGDDASADFSGPDLVCVGESVTYVPSGLTNNSNISWNFTGAANVTLNPDNSATVFWGSFGNFIVTLTNTENGCTASTIQQVGVSNNPDNCFNGLDSDASNFVRELSGANLSGPLSKVFPNPAFASEVQLQLLRPATQAGSMVTVQLYNATGSLVATQRIAAGPQQLKLHAFSNQPAGLYLVRVSQEGEMETHRVVLR